MKILLVGATGLVGSQLCLALAKLGHQLLVTSRRPQETWRSIPAPHTALKWPPHKDEIQHFNDLDAVINLAGESIASGRWTDGLKQRIIASRIDSVREPWKIFDTLKYGPKVWINASAIGYYGDRGENELLEKSKPGQGFLAHTCQAWEKEIFYPNTKLDSQTRKVALRFGMVLSPKGGGLKTMLPAFQNHLGGRLGTGEQYMSWIHIDDLVQGIIHILEHDDLKGPINFTAPEPVTNAEFTRTLGKVLGTATPFPVPKFMLNLILGQMTELLLYSQKVKPEVLLQSGFQFSYPTLEAALSQLLDIEATGSHRVNAQQWIPRPIEEVFQFFCDETNLEKMTPAMLQFKVLGKSMPNIAEGCLIDYKLKLHGIPLYWQSRIESWQPPQHFSDTQIKGPYQHWHHTHNFESLGEGTLATDRVSYQLPFGILGRILQLVWVGRDVRNIFKYRNEVMRKFFTN